MLLRDPAYIGSSMTMKDIHKAIKDHAAARRNVQAHNAHAIRLSPSHSATPFRRTKRCARNAGHNGTNAVQSASHHAPKATSAIAFLTNRQKNSRVIISLS
jgi:hypothetical protein